VALVLGKALIWAVFDGSSNTYLPGELCLRVRNVYEHIPTQQLNPAKNPVKKVDLLVTGGEGNVFIDEMEDLDECGEDHVEQDEDVAE